MALEKQSININFAQGLDTKSDPFQVAPGKFLNLQNSIFTKAGLLQKRNGFQRLPGNFTQASSISTYSGGLIGIGNSIESFSDDTQMVTNKGNIQPLSLTAIPAVRTSTNIVTCDVAISANGLACSVWTDNAGNSWYQVIDSSNGSIIVSATQLPTTSVLPRVFSLGNYLVITFLQTVSAATHLRYVALPTSNPNNPGSPVDISSQVSGLTAGYDGYVANNNLYLAFDGSDGGGAIRITYIDSLLNAHNTVIITGYTASLMSVTVDTSASTAIVWVTFYASSNAYSVALTQALLSVLTATHTITTVSVKTITSSALNGVLNLFYEVSNNYSYASIASDYISYNTCTQTGLVGTPAIIKRSLGLASKAFYLPSTAKNYVLGVYTDAYQPTYFLIDQTGVVVAKLAASNAGGYMTTQVLPSANVNGSSVSIGYLFKDLLFPANKTQGTSAAPIGAQLGINLASVQIGGINVQTSEIGQDLHLTGGFLWMYDGSIPVEHNFHVYPADIVASWSATGGSIHAQPDGATNTNAYFYQVTYEWTDAQGNVHRSAPSIPVSVTTTGNGTTGSITLNVPYLRLTAKLSPNPVRICIYRWSVAQQSYYLVTSIQSPQINSTTADSLAYVDTLADASILGNLLIYTTGGIVENISAPACDILTLFKSRLFLVDSEDQNLIWYSKQVVETTPVEMSDLFTIYVAPTQGAQGSTGPITALSAMDDKLIIFKKDAIYYITGNGPDNLGSNNDFSEPVFITATVGCSNPSSIVFTPNGLLFQSDKGIWLLGRDLSSAYLGAPVERYNSSLVLSAINVPATNQVRFTLDDGITLMFDYFYNQWGTFVNIPAISSTIYQGLHTYLNKFGQSFQENPGSYLDGSSPVMLSFTSSWFNLAGLQGYQRAYFFTILGSYFSPHKLQLQIAYDYNPSPTQNSIISPDNFSPVYGQDLTYGSGNLYGGPSNVEQWRTFLKIQRCESFQITLNELYNPIFGVVSGAGLTLSGIDLVVGIKKGYKPYRASNSVG